jgi:hypothetical protein
MPDEPQPRPGRPLGRRLLRTLGRGLLAGLAWSIPPHFTPRSLPRPGAAPQPDAGCRPCVLSAAERRTWAEIEARYRPIGAEDA